jgi:MOSC domain-containing protein YiiM
VNVSAGGVPKLPVDRAWVGRFGLEGDAQRHDTIHGGPHRAVTLFAIEAIRRVRADGHPISAGSTGENLTTEGVEWATLPVGIRAAIGERLVLEISKPDMPCDTIAGSFNDGRSGRISILTHSLDARMYARVLTEGEVRPGDTIRILEPLAESNARLHELLDRIDAASRSFNVSLWSATGDAGFDVRVVDDGELAMVASPELAGRIFNRVAGYRALPNLLPRMVDWFRANKTVGWIPAEVPPWPDDPLRGGTPRRRAARCDGRS